MGEAGESTRVASSACTPVPARDVRIVARKIPVSLLLGIEFVIRALLFEFVRRLECRVVSGGSCSSSLGATSSNPTRIGFSGMGRGNPKARNYYNLQTIPRRGPPTECDSPSQPSPSALGGTAIDRATSRRPVSGSWVASSLHIAG